MERKENVCVGTEAEQIAEAKEKEGSTAFGKFRDANALMRAYEALEAEFTRRSQRLKELEKQTDNFGASGGNEAEKLLKTAAKRKERERAFDAFVAELENKPTAVLGGKPVAPDTQSEPEEKGAEKAELVEDKALESETKAEKAEKEVKAVGGLVEKNQNMNCRETAEEEDLETLYRKASGNEGVRLRIVGDYLSSIQGAGAPITRGGRGLLVAPPQRAKSIAEAGGMALRFFEKGGQS
ncbi:MAG: hypothetical protein IJ506_08195 [Clostridia bacterium]|nr:hypothetical protein [Clostridia bacterium]